MYSKRIPPKILLYFLLFLVGCNSENSSGPNKEGPVVEGSNTYFFEKAQEEKDPRKITLLLNKSLGATADRTDTLSLYILDHKIYYHNKLKEYDSSLYFADSLIEAARFQKDTSMLGMGYYRKSKINHYLDEQEEVLKNAFESRKLYLSIRDSSNAGKRSQEMAIAQNRLGDYTGSQESATHALRLLGKSADSSYISSAYNNIGNNYRSLLFYKDAIPEYRDALRFSTSTKDSLSYLNNLALVLQKNGEYEEAKQSFEELLKKVGNDNIKSRARYLDNLAYTRWLEDKNSEVKNDLLKALDLRIEENDSEGLLASYSHLVDYYEKEDRVKARNYAEDLLETASAYGNANSQLEAYKYLIALNSGESSRDFAGRYISLNDSLNHVALRAKNTFAKIKFDEERKQQEIVDLESQNAIQQLQTQRLRARSFNAILGALVMILLLTFLLYFLRQRHKKEKIREVQRTESRISKVIHDELANDIFNVMSVLEPVVPEPMMDKLEKIYLRTRDISRENSDIDTGENYLDYLKATLSHSSPQNSKLIVSGENSVNWTKLAEEKKIVIYRVLQELMVNMNKHSNAGLVAVTFSVIGKKLNIQYFDNGCGMAWKATSKGSGLKNVENRINSLNGKISFESEEGRGFKVIMQIPV